MNVYFYIDKGFSRYQFLLVESASRAKRGAGPANEGPGEEWTTGWKEGWVERAVTRRGATCQWMGVNWYAGSGIGFGGTEGGRQRKGSCTSTLVSGVRTEVRSEGQGQSVAECATGRGRAHTGDGGSSGK